MQSLKSQLESILFVADKPVPLDEFVSLTGAKPVDIQKTLSDLALEYSKRGIRLVESENNFEFVSAPENSGVVAAYLNDELRRDLPPSALETLAVIVYKQPVTRSEVEEIRGVNSDYVMRNLLIRGLINEVGRRDTPGKPIEYGTTMDFLHFLGLSSLEEIPQIDD